MAVTTVNGSTMFISYSDDDTYANQKTAVCQSEGSFDGSRNVVSDETNCGILKSLGPQNNRLTLNAVVSTTPGATEASFNEFQALYAANTKKFWSLSDSTDIYSEGYGWISAIGQQNTSGQTAKFTVTIELDGDVEF